MFDLDFSLLPRDLRHRAFKGIPLDIEKQLQFLRLPETVDRLRGASLFLGEVSASNKEWESRAYLRAGLSEFRSVAQALHWDLGRHEVYSPDKSHNPLVHLVFRLRRLTVYIANVSTTQQDITATFRFADEEHSAEIPVLLIDNIEAYLRQERLTKYRNEDISRICDWFNAMQQRFGAPQVLEVGVFLYSLELCNAYADRRGRA